MSRFGPKEFGGTSPEGLANMRALEKLDMPFAQAITPNTEARKSDAFSSVRQWGGSEVVTDQFLLRGYAGPYPGVLYGGSYGRTAYAAAKMTSQFKKTRFNVGVADDPAWPFPSETALAGGFTSGSNGGLLVTTQWYPSSWIAYASSKNFAFPTYEQYLQTPQPDGLFSPPQDTRVIRTLVGGKSQQRNIVWALFLAGSNRSLPESQVRLDDATAKARGVRWLQATIPAFTTYNYDVGAIQILRPDTYLVVVTAAAYGAYLTNPTSYPHVNLPLPRFLLSTDSGETYTEIDLSYLFAGCSNAWACPASPPTATPPWNFNRHMTGGTLSVRWFRNMYFVSFVILKDQAGSPNNILEHRLFAGPNLYALTRIPSPPNYNVGELFPDGITSGASWVYPNDLIIDAKNGRIGLCVSSTASSATNNKFFATSDMGATWSSHYMPWPAHMYGFPEQTTYGNLQVIVAEGPLYGPSFNDIALYESKDFGSTWTRRATLIKHVKKESWNQYRRDFLYAVSYQHNGGHPGQNVESYRFDHRVAVPTFKINP